MPTLQLSSLELAFSFPRLSPDFLATYRILLALTLSIFVLTTIIRVFLFPSKRSKKQVTIVDIKDAQATETVPKEKLLSQAAPASATTPVTTTTIAVSKSKWSLGWFTWESLPALPVSFTIPDNQNRVIGQGLGLMNMITRVPSRSPASSSPPPPPPSAASPLRQQQQQNLAHVQSLRRGTPVFDRPLPSIYQTEVPISMAKIIMSRHTLRRPGGVRPPPPTNSATPVNPSSRRHASAMV